MLIYIALFISVIGILAHLGDTRYWAKRVFQVLSWLYVLFCLIGGVLFGLVWFVYQTKPEILEGVNTSAIATTELADFIMWIGVGLTIVGIFSLGVLIPPIRRKLFKWLPASLEPLPSRFAMLNFILFTVYFAINGSVLYNLEEILATLKQSHLLRDISLTLGSELIVVFSGVGLFFRRNWKESLGRLGIQSISKTQVLVAMIYAVGFFAFCFVTNEFIFKSFLPDTYHLSERFDHVMKFNGDPFQILLSSILLALAAGVGEELLFRGLLQPILGLIPTALLFALMHYHYGITPLMFVLFLGGLLFGWLRNRYSTSVSLITHCAFDFISLMMASFLTS